MYNFTAVNNKNIMETADNMGNGSEKIEVVGIAWKAKLGAVVKTKEKDIYYVENLEAWETKYLNKEVLVTGELIMVNHEDKNNDGLAEAGISVGQKIIRNAEWKLL